MQAAFHAVPILAQEARPPMSLLQWMLQSLGPFYALVLPLAGLAVFAGACAVVFAGRRPAVVAAYLPLVPLPFLIGIYGSLQGFIASLSVIATAVSSPPPSAVAEGVSTGLFTSLVGLLLTFPSYLLVSIGLLVRAAQSPGRVPNRGAVVKDELPE